MEALAQIVSEALYLVLLLSAPVLAVSLGVALVVGLLQAATQLSDATLAFVPRLLAIGAVLVVSGGWMGEQMLRFTTELWQRIPELVQ